MYDGVEMVIPNEALVEFNKSGKNNLKSRGKTEYGLGYQINGRNKIKMRFRIRDNGLHINGSLPFAIRGNSFQTVSIAEVEKFLKDLSALIKVDLFKAVVKNFEAGTVVETPFDYPFFANNHTGIDGFGNYKVIENKYKNFSDGKLRKVKLYDAGKNLNYSKVSGAVRQGLIKQGMYNPMNNYVKYEVKYLDPAAVFKTPGLTLGKLFTEGFIKKVKNDVLNTYKSINKTGYSIEATKGKFTCNTINEVIKRKYEMLTGISASTLESETIEENSHRFSADGKCRRKKVLKKEREKIKPDKSAADIYDQLCEKLGV